MEWALEKEELGKELTILLYENGMIKTWFRDNPAGWRLISGLWSPFYIQLRPLSSYPNSKTILNKVGTAMGRLLMEEIPEANRIVGIASAGIPIAIATTIFSGIPSCYTRKLEGVKTIEDFEKRVKEYGEHSLVEGMLEDNDNVVLVDDLATKFDSKAIAFEQVKYEIRKREKEMGTKLNITCKHVAVLLDREQGATEKAESLGVTLHSLIPFKTKCTTWLKERMADEEYNVIRDYLQNEKTYQSKEKQDELYKIALKR